MKILGLLLLALSINLAVAEETATFRLTITSNWNQVDHLSVPGSAHFSPVVVASHNSNYSVFAPGSKATSGFELVAEIGNASRLRREIRDEMRKGNVGDLVVTSNQFVLQEPVQTLDITVSKDHPYISLVSMIAPSPDWVIGIASTKLYTKEAGFCETIITKDLFAYDAGTEEGDFGGNFSLNNSATSPIESLSLLTGQGFNEKFATLTIERVN